MLTVHQAAKSFALKTLFSQVNFNINSGDRIGLVGPNGCGKTTLLRLVAGELTADGGHVATEAGLVVGYLPQGYENDPQQTLAEVIGRAAGDATILETDLVELAQALARRPEDAKLQQAYDSLLQRISRADAGQTAATVSGLGLDQLSPEMPVGRLSGGQKTRLNLALVLLEQPQLLLLDEPTNHLDITMLEWLETWLAEFDGGALIVSHDRTFLNRTVNRILAFEPHSASIREFAGNYADYRAAVDRERERQWAQYQDQQQEIRRIKQDILRVKSQAVRTERQASSIRRGGEMMKLKGYKDYQQGIAKKVAKKAKARESKLERFLESEERVARPVRSRRMRLDFAEVDHLGRSVLGLHDLDVGYSREDPLLTGLRLTVEPGARIVLTGPNGSGKTTLLRTLAGQLPPLAGRVDCGPSVNLGYMTQEHDGLDSALTALQTMQPFFENVTEARTFLSYFLFTGEEPLLRIGQLSYGQRSRLTLAKLVAAGCNVLMLDEPINHLDILSRDQFEAALNQFTGSVLAVIHDRFFIERFATEVWWVENMQIRRTLQDGCAG